MSTASIILFTIVLIIQCYLIFLFFRVISNAARFVLLTCVFSIVGCAISGIVPHGEIEDGNYIIDLGFLESSVNNYSLYFGPHTQPFYVYLCLFSLSCVAMYFVPKIDKAVEERKIFRELMQVKIDKMLNKANKSKFM